ncbi:MAG: peptide chain release factor N(5)-glutamine methyltransferase [Deltaproteobacteria bacterium]|nr:peptide chain release factor N(5)-glutamine methyltransferase [Deltaproteobacteria bacterium]
MSMPFYVDKNVLIPRPETECMVEWILKNADIHPESRILDLGTGSGCIAATILKNTALNEIFISDISQEALNIAEINLKSLCPEKRYTAVKSSLFENIQEMDFDLIVSNPPYIKRELLKSLMPEITEFEPRIALDGGDSGDEIIHNLITESAGHLKKDALLVFEHSEDFNLKQDIVKDRFEVFILGRDYSDRYRFTVLKRK